MNRLIPIEPDHDDPRALIVQASDMAVVSPFASATSGTGAAVAFTSVLGAIGAVSGRYGIASLATGTTTTGRAQIQTPLVDQILFGYGRLSMSAMILTPSSLSDGTNRYGLKIGFGNQTTLITEACGGVFRYRDNINSGNWQVYVVDSASSLTQVDTGITVAASTWYRLEIIINPAASISEFFINGVRVATVTANLQSGTSITAGLIAMIIKSLGTTSRTFYIDNLEFRQEVNR
jgi:hypothetical protein